MRKEYEGNLGAIVTRTNDRSPYFVERFEPGQETNLNFRCNDLTLVGFKVFAYRKVNRVAIIAINEGINRANRGESVEFSKLLD